MQHKIDEMGTRLETFPHQRLQGRPEFKLRVADYRVLYEFDLKLERLKKYCSRSERGFLGFGEALAKEQV